MIRLCYQGASAQRDRRVFIAAARPDIEKHVRFLLQTNQRAGKERLGIQRGGKGLAVISDWASSLGLVNVRDWTMSLGIMNISDWASSLEKETVSRESVPLRNNVNVQRMLHEIRYRSDAV